MIIRTNKRNGKFMQIDNRAVKDKRLSLTARGLLAFILSNESNWQFTSKTLSFFTGAGITQVNSCLNELMSFKYIIRTRKYENGKFKGFDYTVLEYPDCNDYSI